MLGSIFDIYGGAFLMYFGFMAEPFGFMAGAFFDTPHTFLLGSDIYGGASFFYGGIYGGALFYLWRDLWRTTFYLWRSPFYLWRDLAGFMAEPFFFMAGFMAGILAHVMSGQPVGPKLGSADPFWMLEHCNIHDF